MSTDELLVAALRLPRDQRARVAAELLSSLEEVEDDVARAWADELTRRSHDLASGRVQAIPWETIRTSLSNELRQRRAGRPPS
jgi:putative addiction module component (TIGR02574 family)